MFIKNTSKKIIGFGGITVLPDNEIEIPDSFSKNPVVTAYEKLGYVQVLSVKTTPAKKEAKTPSKKAASDDKA